MALLKGMNVGGYVQITRNVRFMKAVDLNNTWNDTFYVDYDNGSDGSDGLSTSTSFKNLRYALTKAGKWDVIYIRPRDPALGAAGVGPYLGGDPGAILPDTVANWVIPYTKHGISLIGTGVGFGHPAQYQAYLKGASTVTDPTLDIQAPFVNVENLSFHRGSSTSGQVRTKFYDSTAPQSFSCSFNNCLFRLAAAGGGLVIDSAWVTGVYDCTFLECLRGINIDAINSVPKRLTIKDCNFHAVASQVDCDIYGSGAVDNILIDKCVFTHAIPSGGAVNKYIVFSAASTGMFSDGYMGAAATAVATNTTLNGVLYSGIHVTAGVMLKAT